MAQYSDKPMTNAIFTSKPRILLNAAPLCSVMAGVARYTRSLYKAVLRQQLADVAYFCNGKLLSEIPGQAVSASRAGQLPWRLREVAREVRLKVIEYRLRSVLDNSDFQLYHETGVVPLLRRSDKPVVMTIYDLSLLRFSQYHPLDRVRMFERHFESRRQGVDHFITISDFIRGEAIQLLGIPPEKITAIPLGVEENFRRLPADRVEAYRSKRGLPKKYVLTVGTHEPRKNMAGLIRALSNLPREYVLVSAGGAGWLNDAYDTELERHGLQDRVIWLGHVPDEELAWLYNAATLMVYPSLYEGFGLPILEAMVCGCPVICSDRASMPEVAGDAALLVNPEDEIDLAEKIRQLMEDEPLRRQLASSGTARAGQFSWSATANRTIAVFNEVLGNKTGKT
jgi:alpha-1,3-rhamnosyl/mannosyltransferase